ncbi:MAG: hypothetical protein U9R32_05075, partial [Bacteroidota bacterium]|nr:hypothetical protein [Bacteroidota bacterium]
MEKNRFQELINRLELFIRKYYTDKVLKGIIYLVFSTSLLYGGFVLMEDVFYFESVYRKIILFSFLGVFVLLFCVWIVLPLIKLFKFSKRLSYDEAAVVIGEYFPDISDSLINTINLNKHIHESETSVDLLIASINQRIENIKPFDFRRVIDFRKNISYLRWAIIPLLIVIIVMLFAPEKIILPTKRIVHFKQHFEKPQPFHFKIENSSLSCLQNSDFEVICTTYGDVYPEKVYIVSEGQKMLMKQNSAGVFTYVLRSLQKDMKFNFESAELRSKEYLLEVFPVPVIIEFETELDFPAYTKKRDEILKNSGDLFVPEGTAVRWNFFTRDVKGVKFSIGTHDTSLFCNDNFNKVSYKYRAL